MAEGPLTPAPAEATAVVGAVATPHGREALPTWGLFALLAVGYVGASMYLNGIVMDDRVLQALAEAGAPGAGAADAIARARSWARLGYFTAPLLLFLRVGTAALLVHLALLASLRNPPLSRIFRATLWGSAVLLAGNVFQTAWLTTVPVPALLQASREALPGSLITLLPPSFRLRPEIELLAGQLTVFDAIWPLVVALCLDLRPRVGLARTLVTVGGVWLSLVLVRWFLLLYLLRMA